MSCQRFVDARRRCLKKRDFVFVTCLRPGCRKWFCTEEPKTGFGYCAEHADVSVDAAFYKKRIEVACFECRGLFIPSQCVASSLGRCVKCTTAFLKRAWFKTRPRLECDDLRIMEVEVLDSGCVGLP